MSGGRGTHIQSRPWRWWCGSHRVYWQRQEWLPPRWRRAAWWAVKSVTRIKSRRKIKRLQEICHCSRNLLETNCIYWFVEFVSYFASSNNDSELVESIIRPSKVVFAIIHLLLPDTDGHRTQGIINSKVILVVYNDKNKCLNLFVLFMVSFSPLC